MKKLLLLLLGITIIACGKDYEEVALGPVSQEPIVVFQADSLLVGFGAVKEMSNKSASRTTEVGQFVFKSTRSVEEWITNDLPQGYALFEGVMNHDEVQIINKVIRFRFKNGTRVAFSPDGESKTILVKENKAFKAESISLGNRRHKYDYNKSIVLGPENAERERITGPIVRQASNRPNIIVVMLDDAGYGDVGYMGNPLLETPNLDRHVVQGMKFNRFYSGSPICHPTRAALLTGRHGGRAGFMQNANGYLRRSEITIAEMLKEHSYNTGHFGKWAMGSLTTEILDGFKGGRPEYAAFYQPPSEHGFDEYLAFEKAIPSWNPFRHPETGAQWDTRIWTGLSLDDRLTEAESQGSSSKIIMDKTLDFIERNQSTPFFANVWMMAPHTPNVKTRENPWYVHYLDQGQSPQQAAYNADLSAFDEQYGRMIDKLEELGIADNTLILFFSDNGGTQPGISNQGGLSGFKRELDEGGIRVPGFAVWPNTIPAGGETNAVIYSTDVFTTVARIIGKNFKEYNRPYDGKGMYHRITGATENTGKPVNFWYFNDRFIMPDGTRAPTRDLRAIILDNFKLLSTNGGENWKAYNVKNDAAETRNIVDSWKANHAPYYLYRLLTDHGDWYRSVKSSEAGNDY